jgi:hypothetical protein
MRTFLFALVSVMACAGAPADTTALRTGGYHYSAGSATGQPLLSGHLELEFTDDSTLRGTWVIGWVPGADTTVAVGPQVGSGDLVGSRRGDTLLVQLNPTNADNNVALQAVLGADGYTGRWEWITIAGPRTAGAFVAAPD